MKVKPQHILLDIRCPREYYMEALSVARLYRGNIDLEFDEGKTGNSFIEDLWTPYCQSIFSWKKTFIRWFLTFSYNGTMTIEFIKLTSKKGEM